MGRTGRGLLDTSVVILLPRIGDGSMQLPEGATIASLTLAELCVGPVVAPDPEVAALRAAEVDFALSSFPTIPFDVAAAKAYGHVVGSLRAAGRKPASRTTDALIAAVALANGLALYTCNPGDFAFIDGLDVVPVPHPDRN